MQLTGSFENGLKIRKAALKKLIPLQNQSDRQNFEGI
jgi:hypothetical protein